MPTDRFGFELPLLLAGAFRAVIDALHAELAERGHPDARPIHGFALQAIGADGVTVSELGRRLGVSKQAASKTVAGLKQLSFARRVPHPGDARAILLVGTSHGDELLGLSAEIFERLRDQWADQLGASRLRELPGRPCAPRQRRHRQAGRLPRRLR